MIQWICKWVFGDFSRLPERTLATLPWIDLAALKNLAGKKVFPPAFVLLKWFERIWLLYVKEQSAALTLIPSAWFCLVCNVMSLDKRMSQENVITAIWLPFHWSGPNRFALINRSMLFSGIPAACCRWPTFSKRAVLFIKKDFIWLIKPVPACAGFNMDYGIITHNKYRYVQITFFLVFD